VTRIADRIQQLLDTATAQDIASHLTLCDAAFAPPLSQRVDIPGYAAKLSAHAMCFEAWDGDVLVGLVAAYPNRQRGEMFITNVSVSPEWRGLGLAASLIARCADTARGLGAGTVALEVAAENVAARRLYDGLGFRTDMKESDGAPMSMTLKL
jgi:ribosomal protein S18 acetylase RimI-like enzyme